MLWPGLPTRPRAGGVVGRPPHNGVAELDFEGIGSEDFDYRTDLAAYEFVVRQVDG